jgi:predicted GIY-YIG superfamily endonuclease
MVIYVLRLENRKFYVGRTNDLHERISAHLSGTACEYTKKYKMKKVIEIIESNDAFDEDKITKKYMARFGIHHVRGGSYTTFSLDENIIKFLQKEIYAGQNRCYQCGKLGHYQLQCTNVSLFLENSPNETVLKETEEKKEEIELNETVLKETEEKKDEIQVNDGVYKEMEEKKDEIKVNDGVYKEMEEVNLQKMWMGIGNDLVKGIEKTFVKMERESRPIFRKINRDIKKIFS